MTTSTAPLDLLTSAISYFAPTYPTMLPQKGDSGAKDSEKDAKDIIVQESSGAVDADGGKEKGTSNGKKKISTDGSKIRVVQRGIWTVWEHVPTWSQTIPLATIFTNLSGFWKSIPFIKLLMRDLWGLGPILCIAYVVAQIAGSVIPTLRLAQSQRFMLMIETAVTTKEVDRAAVTWVVVLQVFFSVFEWATWQLNKWCAPVMQQRFRYMFNQRLLSVRLRLDLPTSESEEVTAKLNAAGETYGGGKAWEAFEKMVGVLGMFLEVGSQAGFILGTMLHQPGGGTVVSLCLIGPFLTGMNLGQYYGTFYARITNTAYLRSESLFSFSRSSDFKKEVMGNGVTEFVQKEYAAAVTELGDLNVNEYPGWPSSPPFALTSLLRSLLSDSALVLLGLKIMARPDTMKITSVSILEYTTNSMTDTLYRLYDSGEDIMQVFQGVKALYEINDIQNIMKDGEMSFPPYEYKDEKGMKLEFKNVSFTYPGTDKVVIEDLSFIIPAGSLCVIVGENGCGKSSSIKLISRLYDVSKGDILLDDKPIREYKMDDVRMACAVMHQDYKHFNFTLSENIGFGNVSRLGDIDAIKEAARLGGAYDFIAELPDGFATDSSAADIDSRTRGDVPDGSALDVMIKNKKAPPKAFSGGQTQRLALSRAFMRSNTCDSVKLLAYDEPSAALDPKAEFELFERLRNLRGGKTMLFVTHRFGYLTKHADLIIYMEKGRAVEKGSHDELLALNGKYASLYNVQAQAFHT